MINDAIIYGVRIQTEPDPFYIGSTRCGLEKRWGQHKHAIIHGKHTNRHFANKCKKYGFENIVCEKLETVAVEDQFEREFEVIQEHWNRGVILTNLRLTNEYQRKAHRDELYYSQPHVFQEKILYWLHAIKNKEPQIARDPRDQHLLDRIHGLCEMIVESLVTKHASGFCALMRGEECL